MFYQQGSHSFFISYLFIPFVDYTYLLPLSHKGMHNNNILNQNLKTKFKKLSAYEYGKSVRFLLIEH